MLRYVPHRTEPALLDQGQLHNHSAAIVVVAAWVILPCATPCVWVHCEKCPERRSAWQPVTRQWGDSMRSVRLLRKRLAGRRKRRRRANYRRGGTGLDGPGGTGYGCHECKAALLVNPYDPDSVAAAIGQALSMPLAERRERHDALFRVLSHNDIQHWADRFLAALEREPTALSQLEQMPSAES